MILLGFQNIFQPNNVFIHKMSETKNNDVADW